MIDLDLIRIDGRTGAVVNYEFHALANIFPLIDGKAYTDLLADVKKYGVREPVWLYEGKILDGRNRYRAAQAMGKTFETRAYEGNDAVGFVVSLNLHRRHLSESQRASVAAKLANMVQGERTDKEPSANLPKVSQTDAAALLNVSTRSVTAAAKVQQAGVPELAAALDAGEVSVSAAAAVAALPIEQQQEVVAAGPQAVREVAKAVRNGKAAAGTPNDNTAFRALLALPPIRQSASAELAIPVLPPRTAVTGDEEIDAVLWLQRVVDLGSPGLITKAVEAAKLIETPMKALADRYADHIIRNGGHTMQAVFETLGFGELERRAKGAIAKAARRHEALSRFGTMEALFADTPAEAACRAALDGMEALQSNHYRFDEAQAAERFFALPALAPTSLEDCLHARNFWDALYRLRSAAGDIGDPDSAGQAHDDFAFAALERIPPRTTAEALTVLDYLVDQDAMNRGETNDILRNLIAGPRE